ncbi:MAG: disulfide bond formation protein B [Nitrosomonadaceae bacterium]|nr:disulfide bond formation protein B [Nitrosomonadaceae bacterium]MDW7597966.1 disulfide bond formation protein B [Nitrosomonadaceae bacterium]MDW7618697.1 disulfide bond formation protein B [Nitrosomonadaceae bacterium]MDW7647300.1 disulfide bond formation protein B [Nitrosomonadaceae bacterium]MDW7667025.1 disulfide bond formation protein B [Nitrosomonadaceae bacterium]
MSPFIRIIFLTVFLICAGSLVYAVYLQLVKNLLPCPLCVAQRLSYWVIGLTAIVAVAHNPRSLGRRLYSGVMMIAALLGGVVATRHSWLVRYPDSFECGISSEEKFLNSLPIARWWPTMFEANGDCSESSWEFMSLTIPDWSAILFILMAILSGYALLVRQR